MNRLTTMSATALLGCALALTGCSSDDKKDEKKDATSAASQAGKKVESAAGEASKSGVSMPSMNSEMCDFDVSGTTVQGATTELSCDDAKAIWAKVKDKTGAAGTEKVEYQGETYDCATVSLNGKTSSTCSSGKKLFAFAAK